MTYTPFLLFHLAGPLAKNIQTLVICRFVAGVLGSSPLSNAAGQIGDMWRPRDRGFPSALYAFCAFCGPIVGPIVSGYISEMAHHPWRTNFWIMFALSGAIVLLAVFTLPETYAPILLRKKAERLHRDSGGAVHYVSVMDTKRTLSNKQFLLLNLKRPFVFLFTEPIVLCLAPYLAILYGTLYAQFASFPIVFQEHKHFSPGEGGLAFLGVGVGQVLSICFGTPLQNKLYRRDMERGGGKAPPESRLYLAVIAAFIYPIGMWWFAWTTLPSIHPIVPIAAGIPFGFGMILVFSSLNAYIIDAYSIYCASAMAGTVLLRATFACAFPLFTPLMFDSIGDQWGISVFAILATACTPLPLIFFKYGSRIRARSKWAIHDEKPPVEQENKTPEPV